MRNVLIGIAITIVLAVVAYFALDMAQNSASERYTVPGVRIQS